ncbi:uncharacterized protein METZ01_LOCUS148389, partial [marine metagenome]
MTKRYHIRPIAGRLGRLWVRLDEQPVRSSRKGSLGQNGSELSMARRTVTTTARQLHRVGGIEHDRVTERLHDRDRTHVGDEVVVAEA